MVLVVSLLLVFPGLSVRTDPQLLERTRFVQGTPTGPLRSELGKAPKKRS